jgi:hypothetical protein
MTTDSQLPPNGAPLGADQLNAQQSQAIDGYAAALIGTVQSGGGQINGQGVLIQLSILQVHFHALLEAIAATGFPMLALHQAFIAKLNDEAQRLRDELAKPKIAVATGIPRKQ